MGQLEKAAEAAAVVAWDQVPELAGVMIHIEGEGLETVDYNFEATLHRRILLDQEKKRVEAELKEINEALLVEMLAADKKKVRLWDGMTFEVRSGRSPSKIEATMLLEMGVALETIQAATVEGREYQFVQVNKPKAAR
jgi:hypothetical protein